MNKTKLIYCSICDEVTKHKFRGIQRGAGERTLELYDCLKCKDTCGEHNYKKPEDFEDALDEIKREIKKEIFSSIWGVERGWKVSMKHDPVVLKAVEVLPESEALLKKSLQ